MALTGAVWKKGEVYMAVVTITKSNFEEEVLKSQVPVLVDFWATWCGPCMMQGPVVEELAEEVSAVKFAKVNVDECMELAQQFRVMNIPTLLLFQDGKVAKTQIGFLDKAHLKAFLGV